MRQDSTTRLSAEIRELGLEQYVLDLEVDGLAVVPPEVTGLDAATIDTMVAWLLGGQLLPGT